MLKKVLHKAAKLTAALILTAGIFSGCSDALDVTAGKGTDAAESIRSVYKDECTSNPVCAEDMSSSASDGTWVRAYKTSNGQKVYHTSAPVYSSTVGGTYKFAITAGRWEVKLYRRFKGAESSSAFEFDVYGRRNADSDPQMSLKEINVFDDSGNSTGTSIFSTRTSLSKDYNNFTHIKTSALGRSSGWLEFKFDAESAAAGSDSLYFDNISFNKKDEKIFKISTSSSTAWSQTGKFQFKIDEALSGTKKVSFDLMPCSNATSLTVRGVDTTTKWIDGQKITNLNEWYHVEFTSTITAPGIGITVYISSKSTSQTVYIKNFKINDTAYTSLPASPYADSPAVINYSIVNNAENPGGGSENPPLSLITSGVDMLNAGPGKDCSSEMTVSWHSSYSDCTLEYTLASDTSFKNAKTQKPVKTSSAGDYYAKSGSFYVYKAYLSGLSSNKSYIYRVTCSKGYTNYKTFKTAGTDGSFGFAWMADVHTASTGSSYRNNLKLVLDKAYSMNNNKNVDFVLFTGDMVEFGNDYDHWKAFNGNPAVSNYMFATVAGNHDYYKTQNGKDRISDGGTRITNKWYLDYAAIPVNNSYTVNKTQKTIAPSNYYFIYNRVLFISLDSVVTETREKLSDHSDYYNRSRQLEWFNNIFENQVEKKDYDYVIVQHHYPFFKFGQEKQSDGSYKLVEYKKENYGNWSAAFKDKKVDFALGADNHEYSRTVPIDGTIYATASQLDGSEFKAKKVDPSKYKNLPNGNLCAFYGAGSRTGCYFNVTPSSITMKLINADGTALDSVTVNKKSR